VLTPGDAALVFAIRLACALPALIAFVALLAVLAVVAPREFTAPEPGGGPVLATAVRIAPAVAVLLVAVGLGAVVAAIAGRVGMARRLSTGHALRAVPRVAWRMGWASTTAAVVSIGAQAVFLVLAILLLRVLWAPIAAQLGPGGEIDVAATLLLVGFVAIWLCIVLAGGALHAWSATTWSRLLASDPRSRDA
jgi:hypothetical protein